MSRIGGDSYMKKFLKDNLTELGICVLTLLSGFLFFTLVADDYGVFTYYNLPAKQFSDYVYIDYYYLGLVGISDVLICLYTWLPNWNWFGISFLFFNFLALFLILRTIRILAFRPDSGIAVLRVIQILIAIFFLENFVSIAHTRFSLALCGIGLVNLLFRPSLSPGKIVLYASVFLLGMLIRPESSMGMILLVSGGYLLRRFDLWHVARRIALPAIFTAALFGAFSYDWHHTDTFVKRVEPEIEYKMMARRVVPLGTMKTAEDSIKYQAARMGMWFDYKLLTPEYLRSLQLSTFALDPTLVTDQKLERPHSWQIGAKLGIPHILDTLLHVATFYKDYALVPALIFTLLILCLIDRRRLQALRIAVFAVYTFLLIYAIDYNAFMVGERHYIGIQAVSLVIILFLFFEDAPVISPRARYIAGGILALAAVMTVVHYKQSNNDSASQLNYHEQAMKKIEQLYQGRLVVVTNDNYFLFDRHFSFRNLRYTKNKYIMFDVFTYSLTPKYLQYLNRECNCDPADPSAVFRYMSENHALYISKPKRFTLTEKYMNLVHRQPLQFTRPEHYDQLMAGEDTTNLDYQMLEVQVREVR